MYLWKVWHSPSCQLFDIMSTTYTILQATPAELFREHPTSLRPAIEWAFQPIAGSAN
jgi:hypothetical protein